MSGSFSLSLSIAPSVVRLDRGFKFSFLINANIFLKAIDLLHRHPSLIWGGGWNWQVKNLTNNFNHNLKSLLFNDREKPFISSNI